MDTALGARPLRAPEHDCDYSDTRDEDRRRESALGRLWVSKWQFLRGFPERATLRGATRLPYADSRMRDLLLTLLLLAVTTARLCGPGGVRAVIAENLLLKQRSREVFRGRE